ncbi:AIR synthase related protein, partial [Leptospira interrogans]
ILMHADGAGTKSSLAYIHYKEYNDLKVFEGIAQDSLVMNLDDLLCIGTTGPYIFSNTIGRNAKLVNGQVLSSIIKGYSDFISKMNDYGIEVVSCGGETADLGDLVRTLIVDSALTCRIKKEDFIDCSLVKPNQVIVGLASDGQAIYEDSYNSGISTNGFTSVRHEILDSKYRDKFPESFAPDIYDYAYKGNFRLDDSLPKTNISIGSALLSPTRTYAPIMKEVFLKFRRNISGIFNNTGGGQTKCLNFGKNIRYVKDSLFSPPPIFEFLREKTSLSDRELYRTLNMGHRLEIICDNEIASDIIEISQKFNVSAKIIGYTAYSEVGNSVEIKIGNSTLEYNRHDLNG